MPCDICYVAEKGKELGETKGLDGTT